ncbi:glycosyltransferase family 2 protein [Pararhodobacter zhoushanensis]|uniref:glycosyltransferase family 2 protein n=1 Tax=Pararhodobacter zhoushanensis TaxID=2479545 RepID=UPI000F8D4CE0|nr:glycosyltransferase family A protein [Pararhodobacter zhoushanensis]
MSSRSLRVGVVIRTKDRPGFVTRALRSVMDQTYPGWRVMLVNDGGDQIALEAAIAADGLAPLFASDAMQALHLPVSIGRSDAFNLGAQTLDTEFVCCLDDDDTWAPGFLEALLDLHDRTLPLAPDLGGVAALVTAVREDLVTLDGTETLITLGEDDLSHAFRRTDFFLNPIAYATYRHDLYPVQWMLNREAVLAAGGFPSAFNVMEDRAFMTLFLQRWRVAILDQKLAFHHRRTRRKGDTQQSIVLNTLDNPSYDWRLFSDLAKIPLNSLPDDAGDGASNSERAGALLRATAATIIKELNDETSGLWHKINGETATLKARLEALDARVGGVSAVPEAETPPEAQVWSLWTELGAQDAGFGLGVDTPFLSRLSLSMADAQPGLMMHASRAQNRMVVQIPCTHDWAALEVSLDGLVKPGHGLRCELIVSHPTGYLFETALSVTQRDRRGRVSQALEVGYVHSCPPGGSVRVVRDFPVESFERDARCKFSVALPRQASDFRLIVHDLVVSLL